MATKSAKKTKPAKATARKSSAPTLEEATRIVLVALLDLDREEFAENLVDFLEGGSKLTGKEALDLKVRLGIGEEENDDGEGGDDDEDVEEG